MEFDDSSIQNIPVVKDRKLLFRTSKKPKEKITEINVETYCSELFETKLVYTEKDLVPLLKGTYKLFARDRSRMPKIINLFLEGHLNEDKK